MIEHNLFKFCNKHFLKLYTITYMMAKHFLKNFRHKPLVIGYKIFCFLPGNEKKKRKKGGGGAIN